ncbi:MAG: hypothetical protein ABIQ40_01985 [Bacteroidia bacterium]
MTKKKSSLPKPTVVPTVYTRPFGQVFLIKRDGSLTPEPGMPDDGEPLLAMLSEQELSKMVLANRAVMFGEKTIGLTSQIGDITFLWDAFLFDFSNQEKPRCFLLTTAKGVALSMLAMIAVDAYLQAIENRAVLIEMLSEHIRKDKAKQKIFKPFIAEGSTIEAMLEQVIRKRLSALFLVNEDEEDCAKLFTSYAATRPNMLNVIFLRKYLVGKSKMLSMFPAFADLKEKHEVKVKAPKEKVIHTEDHHFLKGAAVVRSMYEKLKAAAIKLDKTIVFNSKGSHYIGMKKGTGKNLALFHLRKNSIYLVVMLEEKLVRKMVKKSEVKPLRESVQKFWNGKCTGLIFSGTEHLTEITEVLKKLIKQ